MSTFLFIFSGFKKIKSKKGFLSFNFYLSVFLITFSLVAIILTDSFTQGYKNSIFSKLDSVNPDFKIINRYQSNIDSLDFMYIHSKLCFVEEKIIFSPYIEKKAIIIAENKVSTSSEETYKQREGIYVFGIQESFLLDNFLINKYFQNKDFIFSDNSIIIGKHLSQKINKTINDEIDLLFFDDISENFFAKRFIIQNIYNTQTQNDEFLVYVPISTLRDDNLYCHGIIGDFLDSSKDNSIKINYQNYIIEYWDSHNILNFLNSFDIPIKLLMWILMFLSVYSLSSLIFNILIEKREDLKILYLMGYAKKNLRYIAVSIALYVSFISIFIGSLLSLLAIYLQNQFKIINLPSEKIFQLTFLPAHFDIFYFIKYPIFLILFTIIISLYVFNKNFKVFLND